MKSKISPAVAKSMVVKSTNNVQEKKFKLLTALIEKETWTTLSPKEKKLAEMLCGENLVRDYFKLP